MRRALVFIGIAAASAGLAYWIVRASLKTPRPVDPTTERIQQLIDEANRLLRALDEKKPVIWTGDLNVAPTELGMCPVFFFSAYRRGRGPAWAPMRAGGLRSPRGGVPGPA